LTYNFIFAEGAAGYLQLLAAQFTINDLPDGIVWAFDDASAFRIIASDSDSHRWSSARLFLHTLGDIFPIPG
ncbi:MAG: hypothetical protein QF886_19340, partial [Planctomycetota bacterium]|nr:hypothetical protein [Planctomycetota bacterium]